MKSITVFVYWYFQINLSRMCTCACIKNMAFFDTLLQLFGIQSTHLLMWYRFYTLILDNPQCGLKRNLLNKHKMMWLLVSSNLLWSFAVYQSIGLIEWVLICRSHIFRISVGEAKEFVLVQVHDDKLVRRSQVHRHLGELLVKVTGVPTVPLQVEFTRSCRRENMKGREN